MHVLLKVWALLIIWRIKGYRPAIMTLSTIIWAYEASAPREAPSFSGAATEDATTCIVEICQSV